LRGVLDDRNRAAHVEQSRHVAGVAGVVNRHHRARPAAERGLDLLEIDVAVRVHVDERQLGASQGEGVGRRHERERRHDHRVAGSDAEEERRHLQRMAAR
jgi:hypothetical protein